MQRHVYHVTNAEKIKEVHADQIIPCRRVTGNKEFTINGLMCDILVCLCEPMLT